MITEALNNFLTLETDGYILLLHSMTSEEFENLYNQYSAAIYANIRKMVKPADVAEDILQDVFTVLWTNRAKLDPGQPIGNWLFVVSYHRSISYLKKKLRENTSPAADLTLLQCGFNQSSQLPGNGHYRHEA